MICILIIIRNTDGFLTFQQFSRFLCKEYEIFQPIFDFKRCMTDKILSKEQALGILKRKLEMPQIRRFRMLNNGKLPPISCSYKIKLYILKKPHPLEYDYDCEKFNEAMLENLVLTRINASRPSLSAHKVSFSTENFKKILDKKDDELDLYFISNFVKPKDYKTHDASKTFSSSLMRASSLHHSILKSTSSRGGTAL